MDIFPMIQPEIVEADTDEPISYKDIAWDFKRNRPIFDNGIPMFIDGIDAIAGWAVRALQTVRNSHECFTENYGSETDSLIGQGFSHELIESEAKRYTEECLMVNPYITSVENITISFKEDCLHISCKLETLYGEVDINV